MHPLSLSPISKKPEVVLDPQFEASIASLADAVIAEDEKEFKPGLETFQVHANKLRQEVRDSMIAFQQKFQRGYENISQWLEAKNIENPEISQDNLLILDDSDKFLSQISEGKYIYQILGITDATLINFYKAAYDLAQNKDYQKSRDAFFFLISIAPDVADFWLGLSICTTQLKEYDEALDATLRTIELDPACCPAYQNALFIYTTTNAPEKAKELRTYGLTFAHEHSNEALQTLLENYGE
ncbi:MAG: hypothetical protein LLF94_11455 [Chlamydiales bacterium]|nr:hypothetical protein [Chlamydiales bacterium]